MKTIQLSEPQYFLLLEFLSRTTLSGKEVAGYLDVLSALRVAQQSAPTQTNESVVE